MTTTQTCAAHARNNGSRSQAPARRQCPPSPAWGGEGEGEEEGEGGRGGGGRGKLSQVARTETWRAKMRKSGGGGGGRGRRSEEEEGKNRHKESQRRLSPLVEPKWGADSSQNGTAKARRIRPSEAKLYAWGAPEQSPIEGAPSSRGCHKRLSCSVLRTPGRPT